MTGDQIAHLGARVWEHYLIRGCSQQPSSVMDDLVGDITVKNGCVDCKLMREVLLGNAGDGCIKDTLHA